SQISWSYAAVAKPRAGKSIKQPSPRPRPWLWTGEQRKLPGNQRPLALSGKSRRAESAMGPLRISLAGQRRRLLETQSDLVKDPGSSVSHSNGDPCPNDL